MKITKADAGIIVDGKGSMVLSKTPMRDMGENVALTYTTWLFVGHTLRHKFRTIWFVVRWVFGMEPLDWKRIMSQPLEDLK